MRARLVKIFLNASGLAALASQKKAHTQIEPNKEMINAIIPNVQKQLFINGGVDASLIYVVDEGYDLCKNYLVRGFDDGWTQEQCLKTVEKIETVAQKLEAIILRKIREK